VTPKYEDPAETARWQAAMQRTAGRVPGEEMCGLRFGVHPPHLWRKGRRQCPGVPDWPARDVGRDRPPPDALTVHGPPPLLTRCSDCPLHGCTACQHTPPEPTAPALPHRPIDVSKLNDPVPRTWCAHCDQKLASELARARTPEPPPADKSWLTTEKIR
jgi:hypothetical protein